MGATRPYFILSCDGGGVRGVLTARLIDDIDASFGQPRGQFNSKISLRAGTSTGGIIALALAAGIQTPKLVTSYETLATKVFADREPPDLLQLLDALIEQIGPYIEELKPKTSTTPAATSVGGVKEIVSEALDLLKAHGQGVLWSKFDTEVLRGQLASILDPAPTSTAHSPIKLSELRQVMVTSFYPRTTAP